MIEFLFGHINSTSRAPMSALVREIAGLANGTHLAGGNGRRRRDLFRSASGFARANR
jgi:hypothetical protein